MSKPTFRVIRGGDPSTTDDDPQPTGEEAPATGDLFSMHASYVGAVAIRLLGRPGEVDDVVQEVFLAAHQGLRDRSDPRAVRRWLAKVAVRISRRRLRTLRAKGFLGLGDDPDYESFADIAASPEQRALMARVYEALDRLPAQERVAWVLRHVEGHRLEDVAELADCSLATAKRRISNARSKLQEELSS